MCEQRTKVKSRTSLGFCTFVVRNSVIGGGQEITSIGRVMVDLVSKHQDRNVMHGSMVVN